MTLSATGAAQVALDGQALASGCTGCDGKAAYATITRFIETIGWADEATELYAEEGDIEVTAASVASAAYTKTLVIYADFPNGAPKLIANDNLKFSSDDTTSKITVADTGIVTIASGTTGGTTANITFSYPKDATTAKVSGKIKVTVTA